MDKVVFEKINDRAVIPKYKTKGSAGADLYAVLPEGQEELALRAGERAIVPTGLKVIIPEGYEAQVRPRSGLAIKEGLTVLNTPGTIDSDYRGEIGVILYNSCVPALGGIFVDIPAIIKSGDRIAQIVFAKVEQPVFEEGKVEEDTDRGAGGFGSTGKE